MDLNAIRGGILGMALGDALGAPHEFRYSYPLQQYTGKIYLPIKYRTRYGPYQYSVIGQITDDTSMAMALLTQLLTDKNWIENNIIQAYLGWTNSGISFLGKNTRALLKGVTTIQGYRNRMARIHPDSQSNGSLMRAFPLIILFYFFPEQDAYQKALRDTNLTNPNPVNQDAILIYLTFLRLISQKVSPNQGIPELIRISQTEPIRMALTQASLGQPRNVHENKGWIVHPIYLLAQGWLQIAQSGSFSKVINWVILQGGDTDTNGAIVGSMLGYYLGEDKMKSEPITSENIQIILSADISKGDLPINPSYSPIVGLHFFKKKD